MYTYPGVLLVIHEYFFTTSITVINCTLGMKYYYLVGAVNILKHQRLSNVRRVNMSTIITTKIQKQILFYLLY